MAITRHSASSISLQELKWLGLVNMGARGGNLLHFLHEKRLSSAVTLNEGAVLINPLQEEVRLFVRRPKTNPGAR